MSSGIIELALTNKTLSLELDYSLALAQAVGDGLADFAAGTLLSEPQHHQHVSPEFACVLQLLAQNDGEL